MYPGGGSLKRFVKVLRLWNFVLIIKMALSERSEFDIFILAVLDGVEAPADAPEGVIPVEAHTGLVKPFKHK